MQYSTSSENYSTTFKDKPSKWGGKVDGKGGYAYKKASYQYSTAGNNNYSYSDKSAEQNIDQLDALLEDLKNERQVTRDKEIISSPINYSTIEREAIEPAAVPGGTITKTTKVMKSSKQLGGSQYLDDIERYATSDYSTLRSNSGFSTLRDYPKNDEYRTREITYETNKSVPSNMYETKSEIYRSNRILENADLVPAVPNKTTTTTTTHLEKDLQDIALTDDILPVPGTKVTTTVRTYTYEIPANAAPTTATNQQIHTTTNRNINYNTIQRNESSNITNMVQSAPPPSTQISPPNNVPQTVVFNTESYSTYKNNEPPVVSNRTYEIREHHETNKIHRNLTPQPPRHQLSGPPGSSSKTIVYNTINKTENIHTLPDPYPQHPHYPHSPSHSPQMPPPQTISGTSTITNYGSYPPQPQPQQGPTTSRYFYKESSNVVNTIHGPPGGPGPQFNELPPVKPMPPGGGSYPSPHPDAVYLQPQQSAPHHGQPPQTTSYNYKYSSTTTNNTRRGGGGPDYGTSPTPAFPVDGVEYPVGDGNPPQRVDDLMQSLGNSDVVDRNDIETPHRKREIDTAVASPSPPHIPTVNKAGREIYYPPGHESMIMKREEMQAGSAAGGRWAKGSGNYEYESGYKSKSKTKSGGAMVPVCLPLCCAMPCTIM